LNDQLARDLDEIVERAADDLDALAGQRLYITGGTGFVGSWILHTIAHANRRRETAIRADILSRDPTAFARREPELAADAAFEFRAGVITAPTHAGRYDAIIHAATPTAADARGLTDPELRREIVDGTGALLNAVIEPNGTVPVLFVSSGAVYGAQPADLAAIPETFSPPSVAPEPPNGYRDGKRDAEALLLEAQRQGQGRLRLARLFAFLGPGLPLDEHFAAGNFIRDALAGTPISISGDGTPYRSYLYPTDLIVWLLAILVRGVDGRAYNVGSDAAVTIVQLAHMIASQTTQTMPIVMAHRPIPGAPALRYVPDTARIAGELGVRRNVELDEAIQRALRSYAPSRYGTPPRS
jgi:dTDP-glucose 4,6-dehydratase